MFVQQRVLSLKLRSKCLFYKELRQKVTSGKVTEQLCTPEKIYTFDSDYLAAN